MNNLLNDLIKRIFSTNCESKQFEDDVVGRFLIWKYICMRWDVIRFPWHSVNLCRCVNGSFCLVIYAIHNVYGASVNRLDNWKLQLGSLEGLKPKLMMWSCKFCFKPWNGVYFLQKNWGSQHYRGRREALDYSM
jgi:hypothetical protein